MAFEHLDSDEILDFFLVEEEGTFILAPVSEDDSSITFIVLDGKKDAFTIDAAVMDRSLTLTYYNRPNKKVLAYNGDDQEFGKAIEAEMWKTVEYLKEYSRKWKCKI